MNVPPIPVTPQDPAHSQDPTGLQDSNRARPRPFTSPRVALLGAEGRMGSSVARILSQAHKSTRPHLILGAALGRAELQDRERAYALLSSCDVIIDFTTASAQAQIAHLLESAALEIPFVSGVTGITGSSTESSENWMTRYAERAPVFWAANFSLGVAVLRHLSAVTARALGAEFDSELYELHHRHKLDAPSGTARVLAEAVCEGRRAAGLDAAYVSLTPTTPRDPNAVHVSAGRGGGVFGDHTVLYLGESERLELKHSALDRDVFARGAVRAAEWCLDKTPGVYGMDDLLII